MAGRSKVSGQLEERFSGRGGSLEGVGRERDQRPMERR
jgi:hypothetical protein